MTSVFLLLGIDAHDTEILGVYETRELAEAARNSDIVQDSGFAFVSVCEKQIIKGEIK